MHPDSDMENPQKIHFPDSNNCVWAHKLLCGHENEFDATMFLLFTQQFQQPNYTPRQEQSDTADRFLDRLALLFARVKKKHTPSHVTATGLLEDVKGENVYVLIAKNGGLEEVPDKEMLESLRKWFQGEEDKVTLESVRKFWKERTDYYLDKVRAVAGEWEKIDSEDSLKMEKLRCQVKGHLCAGEKEMTKFDMEWQMTRDLVGKYQKKPLADYTASHEVPEATMEELYYFWKRSFRQRHHLVSNRTTRLVSGDGDKLLQDYLSVIKHLELLAMPLVIWESLQDFRRVHHTYGRKSIHIIHVDKIGQLPDHEHPNHIHDHSTLNMDSVTKWLTFWGETSGIPVDDALKQAASWTKPKQNQTKGTTTKTELKKQPTKHLHCELQIHMLFHQILKANKDRLYAHDFIGCSKLSCYMCWQVLRHAQFKTRGTHGHLHAYWAFPFPRDLPGITDVLTDQRERWKKLVNGSESISASHPGLFETVPIHTDHRHSNDDMIWQLLVQSRFPQRAKGAWGWSLPTERSIDTKKGGFATVRRVFKGQDYSRTACAIKTVKISNAGQFRAFESEVKILKSLERAPRTEDQARFCNNVVSFQDIFVEESSLPLVVHLVVSPWTDETLEDFLQNRPPPLGYKRIWYQEFCVDPWQRFVYECLGGLNWLHSNLICHNDIKPHNILLQCTPKRAWSGVRPVITDFNISQHQTNDDNPHHIGTLEYKAPELIPRPTTQYPIERNLKSDVWSLGCCFSLLLVLLHSGRQEFDSFYNLVLYPQDNDRDRGFHNEANLAELWKVIAPGRMVKENEESFARFSGLCAKLVKTMLQVRPEERLSTAEALAEAEKLSHF